MNIENNKLIAKNTVLLYFRMIVMLVLGLFTSRIIFSTLGAIDFGLYNVVGSVIVVFTFLNNAMSGATSRFLTFELGKGDKHNLGRIFSMSIEIHALVALIIVILGETIGLYFFYHKMQIPSDRIDACMWTYQLSVFSTVFLIMSVPYNAIIIAYEKMGAFAYISILDVVLKLLIIYIMIIVTYDKLVVYSILLFITQIINQSIYMLYCKRKFKDVYFEFFWDKKKVKEMSSFASWTLFGNLASTCNTEGLNLLLNMFFGPVVNAAQGIAVQVQQIIVRFSQNFQTALNPQITKSYATNDYPYMNSLIFASSKYSFYLLLFLTLPVYLNIDYILQLWLITPPEHAAGFLRIILCVSIIDSMANPLVTAAAATGKIKRYQFIVGGTLLSVLPFAYFILKIYKYPEFAFLIYLLFVVVAYFLRLYLLRGLIGMSFSEYMKKVLFKCVLVLLFSIPIPFIFHMLTINTLISLILSCSLTVISVITAIYYVGLSDNERCFVVARIEIFKGKYFVRSRDEKY